MEKQLEPIIQTLQAKAGARVELVLGEPQVIVPAGKIVDALEFLKQQHEFSMLVVLTAVDYWPQQEPRFHVVYQLRSLTQKLTLQLRVPVSGTHPSVPSVCGVFANANWRERELWDMFGIVVDGHPDPRRILMPPDWEGHPLRKDYPLGYEEPQFSFNYKDIDLSKPYAKE